MSSIAPQHRPNVLSVLLSSLLAEEKEQTRSWLRVEMDQLVEPMFDSLFERLSKKLMDKVELMNQSEDGAGNRTLVDSSVQVELSNPQMKSSSYLQSTSGITSFNPDYHDNNQQQTISIGQASNTRILDESVTKKEIDDDDPTANELITISNHHHNLSTHNVNNQVNLNHNLQQLVNQPFNDQLDEEKEEQNVVNNQEDTDEEDDHHELQRDEVITARSNVKRTRLSRPTTSTNQIDNTLHCPDPDSLNFAPNCRGKTCFYKGFEYNRERVSKHKLYYKCSMSKMGCKARLHITPDKQNVLKTINRHSGQLAHLNRWQYFAFMAYLKERALNSDEEYENVLREANQKFGTISDVSDCTEDSRKRFFRKYRQKRKTFQ